MEDAREHGEWQPDAGVGWRFNRQEFAGSLGDLGTLLPIAIGLILINGVDATAVFVTVGLYYVLSGLFFRTTMPVQPMKVIGAYAIARALTPLEISVSGLWMGIFLLLLALTGAMTWVGRYIPRSTIRGVQLTTGVLLLSEGIRLMLGESALQAAHGIAEPFLSVSAIGPIPTGIVLGLVSAALILLLLESRTVPAALAVTGVGAALGLALGAYRGLSAARIGFNLPQLLPYGLPGTNEAVFTLVALALPQLPMTVGNAVIAQADLTREYFGEQAAKRASFPALAASMGLANVLTWMVGGMPLCHGAGGLAAHYRFGARTAGCNLMIGTILLLLGLLFGRSAAAVLSILPLSVLGTLLVFAGAQLALMIVDVHERHDLFVVVTMLGISLATNLGIGFLVGIGLAFAFRSERLRI